MKHSPLLVFPLMMVFACTGCAATFSYVPLSQTPGELEFLDITSHRTGDDVVVEGRIGNNLGFPVRDMVIMCSGFTGSNDLVARTSSDLYGRLDHGRARNFSVTFRDPTREIRTFQVLVTTYAHSAAVDQTSPGFTKTVGFGHQAINTAQSMANATQTFNSALSGTRQAMNLAGQVPGLAPPPPPSGTQNGPRLIQIRSPLYALLD